MKKWLFFVLLASFAISLSAQQDAKTKPGTQLTQVVTMVIDHLGSNGDLVSTVWDPTPLNAKVKSSKVLVEVYNDKQQLVKGWEVCTLGKCKPVSVSKPGSSKTQIKREGRTKVGTTQLTTSAQVVDLTSFGEGTYIIKAKSGNQVAETTIKIPNNGLARPAPQLKAVDQKGN